MAVSSVVSGFIIGFSVAAPVGPVTLLCAGIAFTRGMWKGFFASLGASAADVLYGALAVSGLTAVTGLLVGHAAAIKITGGAVILIIGLQRLFATRGKTFEFGVERRYTNPVEGFITVFLATLANPFTILFFITVFSGLGISPGPQSYAEPLPFLAGIFLGTATWWLILSGLIGALRKTISPGVAVLINRFSALFIAGLGVYAILR